MDSILEIREKLKKRLEPARYEHTLGVAYTAVCLAMKYGADLKKSEYAGLLHDCAKYFSDEELFRKCEKYQIQLTGAEIANPALIHARLGACLAREKYGVADEEVCHAILVHTTGIPHMSLLDQILFVADYIEPRRYKAPGLAEIRRLAFTDLEECVFVILRDTVSYLRKRGAGMDETTQLAYEYYRKCFEERNC